MGFLGSPKTKIPLLFWGKQCLSLRLCRGWEEDEPVSFFVVGPITGSGEGNGNPLQYSCLGNPMDRGAWQATVYGVMKVRHDLVTKPRVPPSQIKCLIDQGGCMVFGNEHGRGVCQKLKVGTWLPPYGCGLSKVSMLQSFLFILIALGLHRCTWALSSCGEQGRLLVVVHGPLTAVSPLAAEHRLWAYGLRSLRAQYCGTLALVAPRHVESSRTGSDLCRLHWQADSCPLYHQESPPILIWKRKVSSFSWGVVGSSPGETRCYGDFPKLLEEKGVFEMESVAKKCSKIFGLEILIIFEIQLPFIFSCFWIFLSFILLENARSLNILFKNIRWLFFFLQSWAKW